MKFKRISVPLLYVCLKYLLEFFCLKIRSDASSCATQRSLLLSCLNHFSNAIRAAETLLYNEVGQTFKK